MEVPTASNRPARAIDGDSPPLVPSKSYLVCFTSRSGSTLLCDALSQTGIAGRPEEYFHDEAKAVLQDPVWMADWRTKDFETAFSNVLSYGSTPNGVFGSKLMLPKLDFLSSGLKYRSGYRELTTAERLSAALHEPRYIWVTRRDKVRQAISLCRAKQSDDWIRRSTGPTPHGHGATFDFQLVDWSLRHIVLQEASWAEYFATAGISPLTVVYEDFVLDYEGTVQRILAYLGIPLQEGYQFPAPTVQKQADAVTDEWVKCYYHAARTRDAGNKLTKIPMMLRHQSLRYGYLIPRLQHMFCRPFRRLQHVLRWTTRQR